LPEVGIGVAAEVPGDLKTTGGCLFFSSGAGPPSH
jgi:hypothetical protein